MSRTGTVITTPVVWVSVRGDADGLMVRELLRWIDAQEIMTPRNVGGSTVGGGIYEAAHYAEDAFRITQWLESKGFKRVKKHLRRK